MFIFYDVKNSNSPLKHRENSFVSNFIATDKRMLYHDLQNKLKPKTGIMHENYTCFISRTFNF